MIPALFALSLQSAAPAPVCTATAPPPAGLDAWRAASAAATGPIAIGKATGLALQPTASVTYAPAPGRAPKPGTFGGVYTVTVTTPGAYRIALGTAAWIDVVRDGKAIVSAAHTEGPPCSGIRKIVDFALVPGRYTIQLSGAKDASARILVVKNNGAAHQRRQLLRQTRV